MSQSLLSQAINYQISPCLSLSLSLSITTVSLKIIEIFKLVETYFLSGCRQGPTLAVWLRVLLQSELWDRLGTVCKPPPGAELELAGCE